MEATGTCVAARGLTREKTYSNGSSDGKQKAQRTLRLSLARVATKLKSVVRLEVIMAEIVLEEDDCLKLVVEAEPGDVRVCFREKENGPYGWFETSACWHEIDHLEKALSLVKSNAQAHVSSEAR